MDIVRAQDEAALIRSLKTNTAFNLTADQLTQLESLAQIYDSVAARSVDDNDVQFQTAVAAWERTFAASLAVAGAPLISDAASRTAYVTRLTVPAPPPPTSTDLLTETWPATAGTPASTLNWVIDGTGGTVVQQGDGTAAVTTSAIGGYNDGTRIKAIHVAKPGEEVITSFTLASSTQDASVAVGLGDNTWSSVDGELPTNGVLLVLVPAQGVIKSRYIINSVKEVTQTAYAFDPAHLKVNVATSYDSTTGTVGLSAWNEGSARPGTPNITFTDTRLAAAAPGLVMQTVVSGSAAAAAQTVVMGPVDVNQLTATVVPVLGQANIRAATGVYIQNYQQPAIAAWAAAHGVTPVFQTQFLDTTSPSNFRGSAFGTFAPVGETGHAPTVPFTSANIGTSIIQVAVSLAFKDTNSLASVASGACDADYAYAAARMAMVSPDGSQIIIRLGWEWDGNWFRWAINYPEAGTTQAQRIASYNAAFRRVVGIFRAAMPNVKFCWCGDSALITENINLAGTGGVLVYPGDAYVDYIAIDTYANGYGVTTADATRHSFWDQRIAPDLKTIGDFAVAHNKKVAIPEWGLSINGPNSGAGDWAEWITNILVDYLKNGQIRRYGTADRFGLTIPAGTSTIVSAYGPLVLGYHAYFDTSLADGTDFRLTTFPNGQAAYNAALA